MKLLCPDCKEDALEQVKADVICRACGSVYSITFEGRDDCYKRVE
jgi:uncharacterized protein YbaR (Trm112 family)